MYEDELAILKKSKIDSNAVQVLVENVYNLDQVYKLAERCNEPTVWSQLDKAQLHPNTFKEINLGTR